MARLGTRKNGSKYIQCSDQKGTRRTITLGRVADKHADRILSHIDDLVRGKMMEEVMRVLMVDDYKDEQSYLNFEVNNHALAYSVEPHMYKNLLDAVKAVVKETIADQWTDDFEKAWDDRIAALSHEIEIRQPA